ncbi:MAG: hypothetical protein EHM59_09545, partial [Betaproteobacteria bacterium]
KIAAMAPRARVAFLYGATEAEPIALAEHKAYGAAERSAMRAGGGVLAGRPIEEIAVRILADPQEARQREDMTVSRQIAGEIAVSGPHVSKSYLDPARNTDRKLTLNGVVWHRTGDAGYLDESARLWLVGRCSGKAADAGVDPLRVEAALADAPGIARATLVERGGRLVRVYQRARGNRRLEASEIASQVSWCHADEVAEVQAIPMDTRHHAKVDIPRLETMLDRGACISRVPCVLREEPGL